MLLLSLFYEAYYLEALYQAPLENVSVMLHFLRNDSHFIREESGGSLTIFTPDTVYRVHQRQNRRLCDVLENTQGILPNVLPDVSLFNLSSNLIRKRGRNCYLYKRLVEYENISSQYAKQCDEYQDFYCADDAGVCVPVEFDIHGQDPSAFGPSHTSLHNFNFFAFDTDIEAHTFQFPDECKDAQPRDVPMPVQRQTLVSTAKESGEELDYRLRAILSPVSDELSCNASYAFALAGMIEARLNLKLSLRDKRYSVNSQELLSCLFTDLQEHDNNGCAGGNARASVKKFVFDLNGRVPLEESAYQNDETECTWNEWTKKTIFSSFFQVDNTIAAIKEELHDHGPIIADIYATESFFKYAGGVFELQDCEESGETYTVLLVGYGRDVVYGDYWILKASLGSEWGIDGYMYLSVSGKCPILESSYGISVGVNGGAIASIIILFTILLAAIALVIWFCLCRENRGDDERERLLQENISSNQYD